MPQMKGLHINQFLTNLSVQYKNAAFVNESLFPQVMVEKESDLYPVYSQNMMFQIYKTNRSNGGRSAEVDWTLAPNGQYTCSQYALKDIVTDRDVRNADTPLTVEVDTMEFVQNSLDLEKEYRAASLALNTATYLGNAVETYTSSTQWSNYSGSSHPFQDIRAGIKTIWTNARVRPNTIVIPQQVADVLVEHPDYLERLKYTDPNLVTDNGLPSKLVGLNVVVAGGGYNAANPGQTASIADIWGKNVILAYVDPAPKLKSISFGKSFRVAKYVKKWRDDEREGNIIECNDINTISMVANACGFLFQGVTA